MRESSIESASWPPERVGEALHALARATGLATTCRDAIVAPAGLAPDDLHAWIDAAAELGGLRATQVMASLDEMAALLMGAAPLLLRLDTSEGSRFLAVTNSRGQTVHVLGPDLRRHRLQLGAVCDLIRKPFEPAAASDLDRVLDRVGLSARRRARARAAMMADRLQSVRLRSCWLVRLPPGCPVAHEIQETRFAAGLTWLFALHLAQYGVFVASWWLLGRGLLTGTIDTGWLAGWLLLVITLVPLRVAASWRQGVISTTAGSAIRRRLLRGALRINRESIKAQGSGQLFGVVAEAEAVESLALNGGITSLFAFAEIIVAAAVVYAGAGIFTLLLLLACVAAAVLLSWRFVTERRKWTAERLHLTDRLLETMTGHRTRLAQQPVERWHPEEDATLARYLESGQAMDKSGLRLQLMPRVWLTLAIAAMTMALVSHASAGSLIASIGGILLAYRSLKRLATGLSSLSGAVIAGQAIRPLAEAAAIARATAHPNAVVSGAVPADASAEAVPAVQARTLAFRYPHQAEPVLDDCTLSIAKGARVLLEGASGSGKTTLASIVAGLEQPDSGLLLIDGLDRSILGDAGWRRRVVMAPEAHDNYLITGSLAFNLLLGRRWPAQRADLVEAEEVCRELGLGDLLDRMPGGLHQLVGETGWQLSQGERTRVFLARALLHKPEVLVLDESFSALDPENLDRTIRCVQRRAATVLAVAHA